VGLLALVFPPVAAVAGIAAVLGLLGGGALAAESGASKEKEQAIQRLRQAIGGVLRKVQRKALDQFEDSSNAFTRGTMETIQNAAASKEEQIRRHLAEIADARKQSGQERQARCSLLRSRLDLAGEILKKLGKSETRQTVGIPD